MIQNVSAVTFYSTHFKTQENKTISVNNKKKKNEIIMTVDIFLWHFLTQFKVNQISK